MAARKQILAAMLLITLSALVLEAAAITIPAGESVSVRTTEALDSKTSTAGQTFHATLAAPVTINGKVVIPKGAEAIGRVTDVRSSGRFRGRPLVVVELTALNFDGNSVAIRTSAYQESGAARGKQSLKLAGGGTALGTVIGAVAGAPFLGSALGAAGGMLMQTVRGPSDVQIPAESLLVFTLQSPLPIQVAY